MENNIQEMKDKLDQIKNMENELTGFSFEDPEKMMGDLGIDFESLGTLFNESLTMKVDLSYTNDSENGEPEYAYESDSGFDLRSTEELWIQPHIEN